MIIEGPPPLRRSGASDDLDPSIVSINIIGRLEVRIPARDTATRTDISDSLEAHEPETRTDLSDSLQVHALWRVLGMGHDDWVWGLEFGAWGLEFGARGLKFGVCGSGFGVWGLEFELWGSRI